MTGSLNRSRLVDFLARATAPDLIRSGPIEGVIQTVSPLTIQLVGVDKPAPAAIVGAAPSSADVGKRALVIEAGGGRRYYLGVING